MNRPTCDDHTHVLATHSDRIDATWCECTAVVMSGNHLACDCHPQHTASISESEGTPS